MTVKDALHLMTEAFELADHEDVRTRSYALNLQGGAYRDLGRLHDAVRSFETGCALLTAQMPTSGTLGLVLPIYVTSRALQAETLAALGRFGAGEEAARDGLRMATEIAHLPSVALANTMLGHVHAERGQIDLGRPLLERGLAIGVENGFIHGMVASGIYLAHALVLSGRNDEALRKLEQALDASRGGYPLLDLWTKYGSLTAAVLLGAGRRAEAQAEIERGLSLVSQGQALGHRPSLLCVRANLVAQDEPSRVADSATLWEEAAALAAGMDMRPLVAHCHLGLGMLYRRTGERAMAHEHLTTAATMYREMGMTYWLEKAEPEMRARGA
jgi:tetratricopeptide (TPR) repeat protein